MFKWILLFLILTVFVILTFMGSMFDASIIIFAKTMLLTMIVVSMLYFARQAHNEKSL